MSRWVCSVRTVEALVLRHAHRDSPSELRVSRLQIPRKSAQPLSKRHFALEARKCRPISTGQEVASDEHIPWATAGHGTEFAPATDDRQAQWPNSRASHGHPSAVFVDAEIDIDESQLSHYLEQGLQQERGSLNFHPPPSFYGDGNEVNRKGDVAPEATANTTNPPLLHPIPRQAGHNANSEATKKRQHTPPAPSTRVQSRLARKVRRQQARLDASLNEVSHLEQAHGPPNVHMWSGRPEQLQKLEAERSQVQSLLREVEQRTALIPTAEAHRTGADELAEALDNSSDESQSQAPSEVMSNKHSKHLTHAPAAPTMTSARSSRPHTTGLNRNDNFDSAQRKRERWQIEKDALRQKFGDQAWNPRKRISPDAIAGVRSLHESDPVMYSTPRLASYFQISPEAVRRILKSKWQPNEKQIEDRKQRWERRGERKWSEMAEQGVRPPLKWRQRGVGKAEDGGDVPVWKQVTKGGERWLSHRPPEALFASTAAHVSSKRAGIASKIL